MSYFDNLFHSRRISACCKFLKSQHNLSDFAFYTCNANKRRFPENSFPAFNHQKLSSIAKWDFNKIDPHQIGLPLNSFLLEVSELSGQPFGSSLLALLNSLTVESVTGQYECQMPEYPGTPKWETNILNPTIFFTQLRNIVDLEIGQTNTANLWKKHRIDIAVNLAASDTTGTIRNKSVLSNFTSKYPLHPCIADLYSDLFPNSYSSNVPADPRCRKECLLKNP